LGWIINDVLFFFAKDTEQIQLLYDTKLPFVSISCIALTLVVLRFYRLEANINMFLIAALFIIPILTAFFSATTLTHSMVRSSFTIIELAPRRNIYTDNGFWFWVNAVYSYILLSSSVFVVLTQHKKLPSTYRVPSVILILGILVVCITNVTSVLNVFKMAFDVTIIGMCTFLVFVQASIFQNSSADFLVIARNDIFNFIDESVFILDNNRTVLDTNNSAKIWLSLIGFKETSNFNFMSILNYLKKIGANVNAVENTFNDIDIYFSLDGNNVFYSLEVKEIKGPLDKNLGLYVTMMDVTKYRLLIHELESAAGIDALTGLYNRRGFNQKCEELDKNEFLPLSIIAGDVNGLKTTNDTKGHQIGDKLLNTVSDILKLACPSNSALCRTGGDEFIVLLPNTDKKEADRIICNIQENLKKQENEFFTPSMAMASSTKYKLEENLSDLIIQADIFMYENKKSRRGI
jgi:diguanylate cyclase (GGDEF)-like protein